MKTATLTARALAFLRQFRSAPALARECRRRGVKGERGDAESCVVAELLHDEFGGTWCVGVSTKPGVGEFSYGFEEDCPLPKPAWRFASRFDSGRFPDLVRGSGS